jgi:3-oxoacyl-[acyl-carrier protein] reductase
MLRDKIALVTGGAQGIGQEIAIKLAEKGVKIAIIDLKKSNRTEKQIEKIGGEVISFIADVSDENAVKDCIEKIVGKWKKIDILVNNAGIYPLEHFTEIPIALVRRVFEVNVIGTFICSQLITNLFISKAINGTIINIASATGIIPDKYHIHYSASKAAVISLTKGIARELLDKKIRVNAIVPGAIITKGVKNPGLFQDSGKIPEDFLEFQRKKNTPLIPTGMGEPADIANMALFLASDKARYITGSIMTVDGGRLLL